MVLHLVVIISLLTLSASGTSTRMIYVDPENGILEPNCWTGGINLPCKNYDLAKKGALLLKDKFNVEIIPYKNESCEYYTWMYDSNGTCKCGKDIDRSVICSNHHDDMHVSIKSCTCMTYDEEAACVVFGYCPYGCEQSMSIFSSDLYFPLPLNVSELNHKMCGQRNREGRFCSMCMKGFSPPVYSYDLYCIKCNNSKFNWLKFIAIAFIPLTIFYFMVILLRINATNPYLYGYITLNQALGSPVNLRTVLSVIDGNSGLIIRILAIPYTIWNLDYFRSLPLNICLNLTMLQILALDYAIAVYPLALIVITYILIELHARGCRLVLWLWSPFHRCCVRFTRIMDIKSSIIKAFATFLLLSYVKLINSTSDMLLPVKAYNVRGDAAGIYVYYDASYKYFGKEHRPYAIMAITIFLIFVFSPLTLLFIYPTRCFQRCLNSFRLRNHALQVFVDTFQGHYKDGTEPGTRDCRWFAAVYFLARIIIFYIIFGISEDSMCYYLTGIVLIFWGILMVILKPYRSGTVNTYHTTVVLYLALICFSITIFRQAATEDRWMVNQSMLFILLLALLPTLVIIVYIAYYIALRCCFRPCQRAVKVLSQRRNRLTNITTNMEEEKPLGSTISTRYHQININT